MSTYMGDFLGFQIGDIHSSQLNIVRVSSGDRYTEGLVPEFTDLKAQVPGNDGTYYWNSFYTQKNISIDFAFDDLRDEDLRQLKQVLNFKGLQRLIFDETPYKYYMVKCSQAPSLKFICFDYHEIKVYKGEGNVTFVAYYPYAISVTPVVINSNSYAKMLNPGDLPTSLKIYYSITNAAELNNIEIINNKDEVSGTLQLSGVTQLGSDEYICIDTRTHLIEGLDAEMKKTGNLYNKFITSGDFFQLPVGVHYIRSNTAFEKVEFSSLYY